MDKKVEEIQSLQQSIVQAIETRENKEPKTVLDHIAIKALEGTLRRLGSIKEILGIVKYDLVFIGQVGAGKTTAICHLFNLIEEYKTSEKLSNGKTKNGYKNSRVVVNWRRANYNLRSYHRYCV